MALIDFVHKLLFLILMDNAQDIDLAPCFGDFSQNLLTNFVIKIRTLVVNLTHLPRPDANFEITDTDQLCK